MKKYTHIFFDLDHTLLDLDKCSQEALVEIYNEHRIYDTCGVSSDQFVATFTKVNSVLWQKYNRHEATREEVRSQRFKMVFQSLQVSVDLDTDMLGEEFIFRSTSKPYVFEGVYEVLDYLKSGYELHILTNGFEDSQSQKLKSARLQEYFIKVITSENSQARKPHPDIFHYAFNETSATPDNSIIIGDNIETDIKGAINVGMDHVYFNPEKKPHGLNVTFEINHLKELFQIF